MNNVDIKGQDRVINFLINSLRNDRMAGAYLFIGPEGVGKVMVAKKLAKIINCQKNKFDSCQECESCLRIENGSHPDIHWIKADTSGFIKIEDIRTLESDIYLKPYQAKKKVYVIQEAQRMNEEANNALLKTLEEPPLNSLIILTTSQPKRIFSTIVSRCQKIYFSIFSAQELEKILSKEYGLEEFSSHFLANFSSGRLGKALEFKDADIIKEKNRVINFFSQTNESDKAPADFKCGSKKEVEEVLEILINWFRDILLMKIGYDKDKLMNTDCLRDLMRLSSRYSFEDIFKIMNLILEVNRSLRVNINTKIALAEIKEKICQK